MKEKNLDTLRRAIAELPVYDPRPTLWNQIEEELGQSVGQTPMQSAIADLPQYSPPDAIWDQIDAELAQDEQQRGKIRRIRRLRAYAAAAAIALLVTAGTFIWRNAADSGTFKEEITYSEEEAPSSSVATTYLDIDWEEGEDAFAMIDDYCKTAHYICDQPDFKIMQTELETLNAARETLKSAIDNYGNDAELIAQLVEIEYERTDLLKKMVAKI